MKSKNSQTLSVELAHFWRDALACRECPNLGPWRKFPPEARGNPNHGVMILGEAPGRVSLEHGRPFSNPRNLIIRGAIARAIAPLAIPPEEILYFSDAVKCWPATARGANRSPLSSETARCVNLHLRRELAIIRPRVIFAFGVRAASAVLGQSLKIAEQHATPFDHPDGFRVIPLMHPSTINIAGMRRVGIESLAKYESDLAALFRQEFKRLKLNAAGFEH